MRRNLTIALAAAVLLACSLWLLLGRSPVDSDPEREGSARAQQEDGSSSLPEATEGEGEPAAIPDGSALLVTDAASIDLEAGTAGIRGTVRDVAGEPAAAAEVTLYRSRLPADIEEEGGLPLFRLLRSNSFAAFGMPWRGARSGASTSIRFRDEILHGLDPLARVVTDDAGEYLFEGVEDGRYLVAGHGSGTLDTPSTGISYLQGSQETVDLILEAAGSLTGAVVDPGGAPVTHAEVRITGLMVQPESGFEGMFVTRDELLLYLLNPISAEAGTDATGAFSFHGLPALEYQVWVEALPFAAAERTQPVPEDAPLEVVLEPGAVITGVVEGPGGRGLADAGVRLTQDQSGGFRGRDWTRLPLEREGTTGPEGEFTIGGLPEGRYRLSARLGGYQEQEIRGMQLEAGEERQVVLSLELGEVIQGIVQDGEGNPLASVDVRADARRQGRRGPGGWGFPGSGSRGETESDERGRFIIDTLEAGEYRLRFDLEGWAPLTLDAATGGDPVEALLTRGRVLSGRIVSAGETGIERARLSLQRRGSRRRRTVSDEGGRFRIPGLEEGTFTLLVEARGYRTLREEVRSSDGDLGDLALDEAIAIHGVVLGPDGNPLAGARVVGELETEESADAGRDPRRGGVRRRGRGSMGGMG
ncbi:MAG: carboxypeptidase regulatory-like domain-containing protein, partial [Planctomycetota bacterium]